MLCGWCLWLVCVVGVVQRMELSLRLLMCIPCIHAKALLQNPSSAVPPPNGAFSAASEVLSHPYKGAGCKVHASTRALQSADGAISGAPDMHTMHPRKALPKNPSSAVYCHRLMEQSLLPQMCLSSMQRRKLQSPCVHPSTAIA